MQAKELKDKRAFDTQKNLDGVSTRINELESVEMEMLTNLKHTVNEHNKLLGLAKSGNIDLQSINVSTKNYNAGRSSVWK